eukprot:CAMPEP_0196654194 /NCGR_PEP_ID=MMETSP1086-20130531/3886_1 /TAXON_ID=77921 /ORGANISM="Cyanoptyche  gloeocystis , Strain SAG4.97" /LENGTH=195 /DNA_ID=CAMNT_0041985811 /DNA_START=1513 /DNA_END=2100 /DNA_ORIENTATION=-
MEGCVLHWEDERRRVALVVVGVPESWRGDEDLARSPGLLDGVDDVALAVDLLADERVHALVGVDDHVQSDRVVPMGLLVVLGHDDVHEAPLRVRHRLGQRCRGVAEQNAAAVALLDPRDRLDFADLLEQGLLGVQGRFEAFLDGLRTEIVEQGLIVDPVHRCVRCRHVFGLGVDGENKHVALRPVDAPVLAVGVP